MIGYGRDDQRPIPNNSSSYIEQVFQRHLPIRYLNHLIGFYSLQPTAQCFCCWLSYGNLGIMFADFSFSKSCIYGGNTTNNKNEACTAFRTINVYLWGVGARMFCSQCTQLAIYTSYFTYYL